MIPAAAFCHVECVLCVYRERFDAIPVTTEKIWETYEPQANQTTRAKSDAIIASLTATEHKLVRKMNTLGMR